MKFLPGDMYIYQSVGGQTVLWVRSTEGAWIRAFTPNDTPAEDATDEHMEQAVKQDLFYPPSKRPVFIRHGKVLDTTTL